jgi:hypothetical protein
MIYYVAIGKPHIVSTHENGLLIRGIEKWVEIEAETRFEASQKYSQLENEMKDGRNTNNTSRK